MDNHYATSDVKFPKGGDTLPSCVGLTSCVLPEISRTGVSTSCVSPQRKGGGVPNIGAKSTPHWYALRATYGREKIACDYLVTNGVEVFRPTIRRVKLIDGKRTFVEESRIPNIFFAYGSEKVLKTFVYDNEKLRYLRFYYRKLHVGNSSVNVPLVVPDSQMESFKIICAADAGDIVVTSGEVDKFKEGQTVRITEGEFRGVVGKVARYKSQQRVGIIIDGLMTVCTAYIPSAFIDIIDD